jgi:hypothetical protein
MTQRPHAAGEDAENPLRSHHVHHYSTHAYAQPGSLATRPRCGALIENECAVSLRVFMFLLGAHRYIDCAHAHCYYRGSAIGTHVSETFYFHVVEYQLSHATRGCAPRRARVAYADYRTVTCTVLFLDVTCNRNFATLHTVKFKVSSLDLKSLFTGGLFSASSFPPDETKVPPGRFHRRSFHHLLAATRACMPWLQARQRS